VAPLALPRDASAPASLLRPPFPRSEFLLVSSSWSNQVVGRVSAWVAPDSDDATTRADSEAALRAELSWAAHLSLQVRARCVAAQPQHHRRK
jgi:protein arginine N-methyltransferase 5